MRTGRALLAGLGWAGALGGVALCVLIFLSAYLAFDGDHAGVGPRRPGVVRLPSLPAAKVPSVALARPARGVAGESSGRRRARASAARAAGRAPRSGTALRTVAPGGTPQLPGGAPPRTVSPAPAGGGGRAAGGALARGGQAGPTPRRLGDTTRQVASLIGTAVGRVSPPGGRIVTDVGDTAGDAVDRLLPPRL